MKVKKLALNKSTIVNLTNVEMKHARGGGDDAFEPGPIISDGDSCPCVLTDGCPCPSTSSTTVVTVTVIGT